MNYQLLIIVESFILYSFLGWIVESCYISFCNRKWTNRGFTFGPFCPIYGWGAVLGYYIMRPLADNVVVLYIVGALLATIFEFLVALLMKKVFHEVWWDYTEKPFNYQGVICLESTIAWGIYAVVIVRWLNAYVVKIVSCVPERVGVVISAIVITIYMFDFFYHVVIAIDDSFRETVQDRIYMLTKRKK